MNIEIISFYKKSRIIIVSLCMYLFNYLIINELDHSIGLILNISRAYLFFNF